MDTVRGLYENWDIDMSLFIESDEWEKITDAIEEIMFGMALTSTTGNLGTLIKQYTSMV